MAASGSEVIEAKIGRTHLLRQDNGGQGCGMRRTSSSAAGDTSDASNAVHHLGSIHEGDGDAVKASEAVVVTPPALSSCIILTSKCRLSIARSPMSADEMALEDLCPDVE